MVNVNDLFYSFNHGRNSMVEDSNSSCCSFMIYIMNYYHYLFLQLLCDGGTVQNRAVRSCKL